MGKDPNILESRKVFTNVLKSPLSTMDRLGTKKISLIMFQRGEEKDKKKRKEMGKDLKKWEKIQTSWNTEKSLQMF